MLCGFVKKGASFKTFLVRIPIRGYEVHGFDHAKGVKLKNRIAKDDAVYELSKPSPLRITIPVLVQNRALKRAKNPITIQKAIDEEKLRRKSVIISAKNKKLDHRKSQTYGTYDKVPLVSAGWHHRKSIGDYFTINPFLPADSISFSSDLSHHPTFEEYNLEDELVDALNKAGFKNSTNIQHEAIPQILANHDCNALIASETGNGKTLAFLVPVINNILRIRKEIITESPPNSPFGLVLTPGRELADQVGEVAKSICTSLGLKVSVMKGGNIRFS